EVRDIPQVGWDVPASPQVFIPAPQTGETPGSIVIRTTVDPKSMVETIRRTIQQVDPEQPAARVFTLESELAKSAAPRRDSALLLGAFAGVALMLAAVGLAGVIAHLVVHRTHEIGVRVALGAGSADVLRLVVGEAARRAPALATAIVLTLGLGLGAAGAIFTASDAALVEPLPYAEPDRLVHLGEARAGSDERSPTSYPTLLDWRARAHGFSDLEGYDPSNFTVGVGDEARMLRSAQVTAGFFPLLGLRIAAGRDFLRDEEATPG